MVSRRSCSAFSSRGSAGGWLWSGTPYYANPANNQVAAELFLRQSFRRIRGFLAGLNDNDDTDLLATANTVLRGG